MRLRAIGLGLALGAALPVLATEPATSKEPPAGGRVVSQCLAETAVRGAVKLGRAGKATLQTLPADCLITVDELAAQKTSVLLIDSRQPDAFAQAPLTGALNLPLFELKTKPFLKDQNVVVVLDTWRSATVAETCQALHDAGLKARFLNGGLSAYLQRHGWLPGALPAQRASRHTAPAVAFADAAYAGWTLVDLSGKAGEKSLSRHFPQRWEPAQGKAAPSLRQQLLARSKNQAQNRRFVIVPANARDEAVLDNALSGLATPYTFLDSGVEGFRQFLQSQQAQLDYVANPPKKSMCRGGQG